MDELIHYGVKGMKWGVRKDRSSVNSISRYSNKFPKNVPLIYNSHAQKDDDQHTKIDNLFRTGEDFVLSHTNHVYRATNSAYETRGRRYVSALMSDGDIYANNMDKIGGTFDKPVYLNDYRLKKDIKVAGVKVQFKDLLLSNGFKEEAAKIHANTPIEEVRKIRDIPEIKKAIDMDIMLNDTPLRSAFVERMSKKGYDALVDLYDSIAIGVGYVYTPMIMLDSKDTLHKVKRTLHPNPKK